MAPSPRSHLVVGGALHDVGCRPLRLARLMFGSEPVRAATALRPEPDGVELDMAAVIDFPHAQRLVMSAGVRLSMSTFTPIVGTAEELRVSNPFQPGGIGAVELWAGREQTQTWSAGQGSTFRHAIEHIDTVVTGRATATYAAVKDAVHQARPLDLVRAAATRGELW